MEVEVRVVRARVWLSSSLFLCQDGFLSLTRVGDTEHVAHATLRAVEGKNGEQRSLADIAQQQGQQKCFRTVTVGWEEQQNGTVPGTTCPKFVLPEDLVVQDDKRRKANQHIVLPRLDFDLFLLRPRSRAGASARSRQQTVYVGTSGWQLSEKDVEALVSSREVVFLTTLLDGLGTFEVKLRCISSNAPTDKLTTTDPAVEEESEAPTGFSVNWSSSEALQKDLAGKGDVLNLHYSCVLLLPLYCALFYAARLKAEADKKLIAQLKQTVAKASTFLESRGILLIHLHRSRAASKIQRKFRKMLQKKEEVIARLRQEEEARIAAKRAKIREKVVERNRQRAFAMRIQLQAHLDKTYQPSPKSSRSVHEIKRIAEQMETERAKLQQRLAILEMQRKQLAASMRNSALRSNQFSPQRHSDKLLDDELVRAVQELHCSRTCSNQM
ncbi:unnamed protein product [Phytophthora lilii]|uniref:Unnamed protein product n=1 Tax=Phytophthora lilii TaxID=2077276 RepID=A0A9W6TYK2_9STRA|nr:unnamed protein product [Phytophthora lilii]